MAHNLGTACLMTLHLDQHNAQQYIVNVSSKRRLQCFFHLEKNKETKCISMQLSKKYTRAAVSLSKCVD